MNPPPVLLSPTRRVNDQVKLSPRLLTTIKTLETGAFTAASVARAEQRHPGVPLSEMVKEVKALAVELKETVTAVGETIDTNDPQLAAIQRILALLG